MEKKSKSNVVFAWVTAITLIALLVLVFFKSTTAQQIERKYDGVNKIRVFGYDGTPRKTFVMFCGGGFVSQNWQVCNAWKAMAVALGYEVILTGYSTSWFPSQSAAERGISDGVKAYQYILAHAEELGVNTDSIYLCGTSAGAFVALGIVYQHKQKGVKGIINAWGGTLNLTYMSNAFVPVYNISTDYDKIVPVNCGDAFGVYCCGSAAIYDQLLVNGVETDWLVWEGYRHGLVPKDAQYTYRIQHSFNEALKFFKAH